MSKYYKVVSFVVAGVMLVSNVSPLLALSEEEREAIHQNSVHYVKNPPVSNTSGGCSLSSEGTALQGNDNIEKAWNFLKGKGLTSEQTAGFVGNLMAESGLNPKAENAIGAFGIAQWLGGRKTNLQNFARTNNRPVTDLGLQLDFLWSELKGAEAAAFAALQAVKGTGEAAVVQAADVVMDQFERPGEDGSRDNRRTFAKDAYKLYSGSSVAAGSPSASGEGCEGWTGENTQFIDGFTVYDQCDPKWGNNPYGHGSTNVCASGCGPTAMAMIITNLTGKKVTPDVTAKYADSINMYVTNVGSSHAVGPRLAEHWNLKSEKLGNSVSEINKALARGGLVIAAGDGADPFTSSGHFIVIRAVTSTGKWKVGDSAHKDTSSKDWNPAEIINGIKGHETSVYAIYK